MKMEMSVHDKDIGLSAESGSTVLQIGTKLSTKECSFQIKTYWILESKRWQQALEMHCPKTSRLVSRSPQVNLVQRQGQGQSDGVTPMRHRHICRNQILPHHQSTL